MYLIKFAFQSLWNRRLTSSLSIFSIAMSVTLLFGIEKIRIGARESFTNTISKVDLIVGASGGSIQLLLYSVFRIGNATKNVSFDSFKRYEGHPSIEWVIPYSLGDSHKGFRVVATDQRFYEHYRYRGDQSLKFQDGKMPTQVLDVVIGSQVASILKYKLGESIVIAHGASDGPALVLHDDKPFKIVGVLQATNTPIDRSVYITLEGMEFIHMNWPDSETDEAIAGTKSKVPEPSEIEVNQITSFLLRTKNRIETLKLQREINTDKEESLLAIIPGVALAELWDNMAYAESGMRLISVFVVFIGLLGMLSSIYSSLNERRREMAILRAVGIGTRSIGLLLIIEGLTLSLSGLFLGTFLTYGLIFAGQSFFESSFGLRLPLNGLSN
ncbi:MAG: ABC transporter permease, partial [Proteobacteria bacterium]|nr:ABC transporter permease [Pseudomonadota bacterium]